MSLISWAKDLGSVFYYRGQYSQLVRYEITHSSQSLKEIYKDKRKERCNTTLSETDYHHLIKCHK
jgi:hypothetical protein